MQQFGNLRRSGILRPAALVQQGFGSLLQRRQFQGLVVVAARRGWQHAQAKTQRPSTIIGRLQQIAQLVRRRPAGVALDHQPPPVIGPGIAQRAEHAPVMGRLVLAFAQAQLDRIDLHRVIALQITTAIDETPDRHTVAPDAQLEPPGGDGCTCPGRVM
jgi:hypothetical protein